MFSMLNKVPIVSELLREGEHPPTLLGPTILQILATPLVDHTVLYMYYELILRYSDISMVLRLQSYRDIE